MRKYYIEGYVSRGDMHLERGALLRSVVIIKKEGDRISMECVGLKDPHKEMIYEVLKDFIEKEDLKENIIEAWKGRKNKFKLEFREGMSGSTDIFVKFLRDEELNDIGMVHLVHLSMYNKVGRISNLWIGDLPFILPDLGPAVDEEGEDVKEVSGMIFHELEIENPEGFSDPEKWEEDGLVEFFLE